MSTSNDTDIVKLNLNDTFYEWYLRTNQVIDYINPLNVYDVFAGSGLKETRTGTPGTIEISVETTPSLYAIDTLTDTYGDSNIILNISGLTEKAISNTSFFVFSDGDDQSFKVSASNILPQTINGDHTFTGNIVVKDLIIDDGSIIINNAGTNRDNSGIIIESVADGSTENVSFTYDNDTAAWYSNRNLGLKSTYSFVTDSGVTATFPFFATSSQGAIDLQLKTSINSVPELWSMKAEFGSPDTLTFAHYKNGSLVHEVLELQSVGTNNSRVIVKDSIEITDILSSSPFTDSPLASNVPITDSTNGFLNTFVNRVKLANASGSAISAGHLVRMTSGGLVKAGANTEANAAVLGIVESTDGTNSVVIISGPSVTRPRDSSGNLLTLTVGSIYYLVQSATNGGVTSTKPTTGIIKPVGVATSATVLTLIPDNVYTELVTSAFTTVSVADTGESIVSSGADTLSLVGGNYIDLDINTNKQIIINSSITANDLLPTASNYSIYGKQTGNPTGITMSEYSVLTRPLNGNISSVVVEPGGLLGRKDDATDENNPIESLSKNEVLSLLGFSGSNYFNEINFQTASSTEVISFNASSSESFNVRAGENIFFTFDTITNTIVINSVGEDTDFILSPLTVSDGSTVVLNTANIVFADLNYVNFLVQDLTSGAARVTASISEEFINFGSGSSYGTFNPGKTILINGSSNGVLVNYNKQSSSSNHIFTLNLDTTLRYDEVKSNEIFTVSSENYSNIMSITSSAPDYVGFGTDERLNDITIKITHFDDRNAPRSAFSYPSGDLSDKCVSMLALKENTTNTAISYPFLFDKIIAKDIEVQDIIISGTAVKNFADIITLSGSSANQPDLLNEQFSKTNIVPFESTDNGMLFNFVTEINTANQSSAKIIKLKKNYGNTNGIVPGIDEGLVITKKVAFTSNLSQISPTIGFIQDRTGTLLIDSNNSYSEFKFESSGSHTGNVGIDSSNAYLKYSSDGTTNNTRYFKLAANSALENVNNFSILNASNYGWTLEATQSTNADIGKALIVESSASGVAKVGKHFIIQPYTTNTSVTNSHPINTLYYSV